MRENERDGERMPRRESWQPEDVESLTPAGEEKGEVEEIDSIQEVPAGYIMAAIDLPGDQEGENPNDFDDSISIGTNAEEVMNQIDDYTSDQEVLEDFSERQRLNTGSNQLLVKLIYHHSKKPGLSADDIDAAWEDADVSGEESAGGSVATPDQDIVEEIGEALGLEYADDMHLHTEDRLDQRDHDRWELNPASAYGHLDDEKTGEQDLDLLSSDLYGEFGEVEGLISTYRADEYDLDEGWRDLISDENNDEDFDEIEEELDEDFFRLLDDGEDDHYGLSNYFKERN